MRGEKVKGNQCSCGSCERYKSNGQFVSCAKGSANFRNERTRATLLTQNEFNKCYEQGRKAESSQDNPYPVSEIGKRCAWFAGFNDNGT